MSTTTTTTTKKSLDLGRDYHERRFAAFELEMAALSKKPEHIASVKLTPELWNLANEVGKARNHLALLRRLNSPEYRRGDDDARIDAEGAMGDIVLSALVSPANWKLTPLVEFASQPGECDAYALDGTRVDAKTVSATRDSDWVNINEESHQDKLADVYAVIRFRSDTLADIYAVPRSFVDKFKVKPGYNESPYRSVPLVSRY